MSGEAIVGIGAGSAAQPSRGRLTMLRERLRTRRLERARRSHALRGTGGGRRTIPGSEHSHLLRRVGGF